MLSTDLERKLYMIVAEQTDWGENTEACRIKKTVFEILRSTLQQIKEPRRDLGRFRSPPGMVCVKGNLDFYLHTSTMGFWFRQLMMIDPATSTQNLTQGGTAQIISDSDSYTHVLCLSNNILPGLSVEIVEAGKPNTFGSLLVTEGSLHFANRITMSLSFLGREADLGHSIGGIRDTPTDVSSFDNLSLRDAESFGLEIEVEREVYPISDATLIINHNLDYQPTRFGGTRFMPKPVLGGDRRISFSATIDYRLGKVFYDESLMPEVAVRFLVKTRQFEDVPNTLDFNFPQVQLMKFPYPGEFGEMRLHPYGVQGNDEMMLTIINSGHCI